MVKISTTCNSANINALDELISQHPIILDEILNQLSVDQYKLELGKGKRSFHETLIHLVYCSISSTYQIYQALLLTKPNLPKLHPERDWGKLLDLTLLKTTDIADYFKSKRKILENLLSNLTQDQWQRQFTKSGNKKPLNVYLEVRSLILHEYHHLQQLKQRINAVL